MQLEQDWEPLVLRKSGINSRAESGREFLTHSPGHRERKNLMENDPDAPATVSVSSSREIKVLREKMRITQKVLAQKLNISLNTIKAYENENSGIAIDRIVLSRIISFLKNGKRREQAEH